MMRIFIDDQAVSTRAGTLRSALEAVAERVGDRLVVEAQADGRVLSADELTDPSGSDPFAQEMRFRTAEPAALARVTLHDAGVAAGELRGAHARAADLIEAGKTGEVTASLSSIFTTWSQALAVLEMISRTPGIVWPPRGAVDQPALDRATAVLRGHLDQIKSALVAGDWAGLCDILRYEMDEQATAWKQLLNDLADAMTAATP